MTSVGTRTCDQFFVVSHGAYGMAALSEGRLAAALSDPPPPIDQPATASRVGSMRELTRGSRTRLSSAARAWSPRAGGWSNAPSVLIPMTTKPCEASRWPSHWWSPHDERKPGRIATAPNVPWEVSVG